MRPAPQLSRPLVRAVARDLDGLREHRRLVTFRRHRRRGQRRGGTMTSGGIILARSNPASSGIIGALFTPPGTRTLTMTPVPSRSFAIIALSASSAALDGP